MDWTKFSTQTLDDAAKAGNRVHFDLTNVKDVGNVLVNKGPYANTVTGNEIRYLLTNWGRFRNTVTFWNGVKIGPDGAFGVRVPAPWEVNP